MKINSYQLSQFSWSQEENLRLMKVHPGQVDFPASQVNFHVYLLNGQGPAISHLLTKWQTKSLHIGEETTLGKQNSSLAACSSEIQIFFKPPYNFIHFFAAHGAFPGYLVSKEPSYYWSITEYSWIVHFSITRLAHLYFHVNLEKHVQNGLLSFTKYSKDKKLP